MKRTTLLLRRTISNLSPTYRHRRRRQLLKRKPYRANEMETMISTATRRTFERTDATGLKIGI